MNKLSKKTTAMVMATLLAVGSTGVTAFAASPKNSVGSVEGDWDKVAQQTVETPTGQDESQSKETEYQTVGIALDGNATQSTCDVYASQAAGEKVYDPTNDDAVNGFVDGSVQALLPKTVILGGASTTRQIGGKSVTGNFGDYVIAVKGNITGDSHIYVTPSGAFKMGQTGKADIDANMSQTIQNFYVKEYTKTLTATDSQKSVTTSFKDSTVIGTAYTTSPITAGQWSSVKGTGGSPSFTVGIAYDD